MNETNNYTLYDVSRSADTGVVCLLQRVAFFGEVNPMMPTVEQIRVLLAGKQYFDNDYRPSDFVNPYGLEGMTNELLTQQEPASEPLDSETLRLIWDVMGLARNTPGKPVHFTNSKGQPHTITMYGGEKCL